MLPLLVLSVIAFSQGYNYRKIGDFSVRNPSFLKIINYAIDGKSPRKTLFVTSFTGNPFVKGKVFYVDNIENVLGQGSWSSVKLGEISQNFAWPNFVEPVPAEIVKNAFSIADGFLVPFKSTGGIYLVSTDENGSTKVNEVTTKKRGYFYHNITWIDMDGDGDLDILTARATKPLFGSGHGEMLWFENSGKSYPWEEHVITQGPDVMITPLNNLKDSDEYLEVVACQFFTKKLMLYQLDKKTLAVVKAELIDDGIGKVYSARYVDLDGDGVRELLVGNHEDNTQMFSGIFVYQRPTGSGSWTKTLISANFTIHEKGSNQGTPGFVYPFHPKVDSQGERPYLLVAGDGSQEAYLLRPTGTGFEYTQETIANVGGVIGALEINDVDGDGFVEFFVPNYDGSKMQVYSFGQ